MGWDGMGWMRKQTDIDRDRARTCVGQELDWLAGVTDLD